MSKPIDFIQKKANKNGEVTAKEVLEGFLNNVDKVDKVIVVARCKDGEIKAGWCHNDTLNSLGLLEAAKQLVLQDMWEDA